MKSKVIGEECILRTGKRYKTLVGKMACKKYLLTKDLSGFLESQIDTGPLERKKKGAFTTR